MFMDQLTPLSPVVVFRTQNYSEASNFTETQGEVGKKLIIVEQEFFGNQD